MIFLTVGTQLGFDRLVKAVDQWAKKNPEVVVFGQIGMGEYLPKYFKYSRLLDPHSFSSVYLKSNIVVGHAGMGTIINCLVDSKPVVVMPRLVEFGEHRNDHQVATCEKMGGYSGCYVAESSDDLARVLDKGRLVSDVSGVGNFASDELLSTISSFIEGDEL